MSQFCKALVWIFLLSEGVVSVFALRIATLNAKNYNSTGRYIQGSFRPHYPKPENEKLALRRLVKSVQPDILALQEIGAGLYLKELQEDLRKEGIHYKYWYLMEAQDSERCLAVLSKYEPLAVHEHKSLEFHYQNKRESSKRGLLELVYGKKEAKWSIFLVHLKSRRNRKNDPESKKFRKAEARQIRLKMTERYPPEINPRYIVLGDFNDYKNTTTLKYFLEFKKTPLARIVPAKDTRGQYWTHHYKYQDIYSRMDFILVSETLAQKESPLLGYIVDDASFEQASDHRMLYIDLALEAA